jgi:hypothetical protein
LAVLASQLLLKASHAQPSISPKIKKTLLRIVTGLYELSKAPFYMDGGKSEQDFNSSGDIVASLAETAIAQLKNELSSSRMPTQDQTAESSEVMKPEDVSGKNEGQEKVEPS